MIRLKRIYNFLVIHASLVILSHVFTVIYIIFMHFVGLTIDKMPSASFLFLLSFRFLKFTYGNISELDQNLRGLFFRQDEDGVRRGAPEATLREGTASCHGPTLGRGWDPSLPLGRLLDPLRCL